MAPAHALPRPDGLHNVLLPPVARSRARRFVLPTGWRRPGGQAGSGGITVQKMVPVAA